eukprot:6210028-Pleurochrysis_carterae.AAC.9
MKGPASSVAVACFTSSSGGALGEIVLSLCVACGMTLRAWHFLAFARLPFQQQRAHRRHRSPAVHTDAAVALSLARSLRVNATRRVRSCVWRRRNSSSRKTRPPHSSTSASRPTRRSACTWCDAIDAAGLVRLGRRCTQPVRASAHAWNCRSS